MVSIARAHHYLPEFYLAGFTPSGNRDDQLRVFDKLSGKQWQSKPRRVATQRDFYRIEHPELSPGDLEKFLADLETRAAAAIRNIEEARIPPMGPDLRALLEFVSILQVRVPAFRNLIQQFMGRLSQVVMDMILSSPEQWEHTIQGMKEHGYEVPDDITYEKMRDFNSKQNTMEVDQDWLLGQMLEVHTTILPWLKRRKWSLLVAERDAFICGDHPVLLTWTDDCRTNYPPGFGLRDTVVRLPLTKDICLSGWFDVPPQVFPAGSRIVAAVNASIAIQAERQIMWPHENFIWMQPDGRLASAAEWKEWISQQMGTGTQDLPST